MDSSDCERGGGSGLTQTKSNRQDGGGVDMWREGIVDILDKRY